jgi:hypothetical protein
MATALLHETGNVFLLKRLHLREPIRRYALEFRRKQKADLRQDPIELNPIRGVGDGCGATHGSREKHSDNQTGDAALALMHVSSNSSHGATAE